MRIELLTKENYETWKIQVEALLTKNGTWPYVSGEIAKPNAAGDELNNWKKEDRMAKSDLILSISSSQLKHIRNCETAREVWIKLESIYASQGPTRKATLLEQLLSQKMRDGDDVRDYLSRFMNIVDNLQQMNVNINGELLTIMLLHSLPNSYDNFCCAVKSHDALPDVERLMGKIIEESFAREHKSEDNGAMFVKQKQGNTMTSHGDSFQNGRQDRHGTDPTSKEKIKCNFCGKKGHRTSKCFKKKKKEGDRANSVDDAFFASEIPESSEDLSFNVTSGEKWCVDSGCTSHLCKDDHLFTNSHKVNSGVKLASNTTAAVTAKGDVRVVASDGKQDKTFLLHNTLHVPTLRTNLLSVAKIVDNGYSVVFTKNQATVKDKNGSVRLVAKREGDLFLADTKPNIACAVSSEKEDVIEWHRRLGHLNRKDMNLMKQKEAVTGLDFRVDADCPPCDTCAAGKITRAPFPKGSQGTSSLLEVVHTDLCGPMRTESIGGARYLLTFTDDYSRWTEFYLLRNKSEVTTKFMEYKNLAETHTGMKIKAIQSDNGREFVNMGMDHILKKSGIRNRLTAPYTPQQNGVAERKNRTLIEPARCMLIDSGLPTSFWGEAVATACYIRNRCITKALGIETPHERWTGKRPDLRHFRGFGTKVYCLDKRPNKDKLKPRGIEGIFVGYATNAKAYRIWIPSERKIHITRDVRFMNEYSKNTQENISEIPQENVATTRDVDFFLDRHMDQIAVDDVPIIAEPPADVSNQQEINEPERRKPGRPKIVRTGRPGRPSKRYSTTRIDVPVVPEEDRHQESSDSSDEEFYGWENADLAMNVCEIPLRQALEGSDSTEWEDAIYKEIKSLVSNETFDLVDRPTNEKVIKCRTVLRNKYGPDGELERRKARVVAKGFAQQPGLHFFETFAPVARLSSLRLLIALAVKFDLKVTQLDIETAYLNAKMDTVVYMEQPDLLKKMLKRIVQESCDSNLSRRAKKMLDKLDGTNKVCKLNKALYGLRQAGRQWHAKLDSVLRDIGLTPTNADPCVYTDKIKNTFILIYVDDILIVSNNRARESQIKQRLSREFKVKDLGEARYCLGVEITRDKEGITLSQTTYIRDILQRFRMSESKPVSTPLATNTKLTKGSNDRTENETFPYRELVGALMYAALGTRPDISHPVSVLGQFNSNPKQEHWIAAKRVLRYLQGTANHGLKFKRDDNILRGFVDADWANCTIDRRSYTGSVFIFSGGAISWESRKQRTVALSSTEAEYMAITDASKEAIYLINFLKDLGHPDLAKAVIFNDNQGAGKLAENPIHHSRSKHIDVKHHFIRQVLKEHPVDLVYIPTEKMVADVLTKGLPGPKHMECTSGLGVSPTKSP